MAGFWGSQINSLDSKGRINVPAKIRRNLGEADQDTFILIRGSEPCITLYPKSVFASKMQELREKLSNGREYRIVTRRLMYQASEQTIDKQGRLNLPAQLIEYARLRDEVLIVGYEDKIELWDPALYQQVVTEAEPEFQKISQELDF